MTGFDIEDSAAIVTISGWVQIVKTWIPEKFNHFAPLISMICGIVYIIAVKPSTGSGFFKNATLGVVLGLTACGTYSAVKNASERGIKSP